MTSRPLLLIDPNPQTLGQIRGQLQRQGYEVYTASNLNQALEVISQVSLALIISEFELGGGQRAVDVLPHLTQDRSTPLIALIDRSSQREVCVEAGVAEVLEKPIYLTDLRDRVERLIQTGDRGQSLDQQRFFGRLEEMGLEDLLQVIHVSARSGMLSIEHGSERGALWFAQGALHDVEMANLNGVDALNRVMTWEFGQYEFDFNVTPRPDRIQRPIEELKRDGAKYVHQWNKMCEQLPPPETVLRQDPVALRERVEPINSVQRVLINHFDGRKTILEVINLSSERDLTALQEITRLYFEGLIYEVREVMDPHVSDASFIDAPQTIVPPVPGSAAIPLRGNTSLDAPPLSIDTPPPPMMTSSTSIQTAELPPEGRELLAEMYAQDAELESDVIPEVGSGADVAPPPVPEQLDEELEDDDEAYATLFGVDGMFDYAEEEVEFFDEDQPKVELKPKAQSREKPKMTTYAKVMWGVLSLFILAIGSLFAQDVVRPIDITEDVRSHVKWTESVLSELDEVPSTPGFEGVWKIELKDRELKLHQMIKTDPNAMMRGAYRPTTLKPRKLKRKEQAQLSKTMKRAMELKAKRDRPSRERALDEVKSALAMQPTDQDALLLGAMLHLDLGQAALALSYLQPLLKLNPSHNNPEIIGDDYGAGVVSLLIGNALVELKRSREAVQYYESYLRDFPGATKRAEIRGLLQSIK